MCDGCQQLKPPMVVRHTTTAGGVGVPQPPNKKRRLSRKTSCPNDYLLNSLFRRYSHESEHTTAGLHPVSIPDDLSLFHEVRQFRSKVDEKYRSWPPHLKQLAVGLLKLQRARRFRLLNWHATIFYRNNHAAKRTQDSNNSKASKALSSSN